MSFTSLTGFAVLENPHTIPKTKTVVFDLQMFLIFGGCFGRLSYSVIIQPARTTPSIEVYSQKLTPVDYYHIVDDIIWLAPLGTPEDFELRHHSYVTVCGLPANIEKDDKTFEIHAEQYISATKATNSIFPVKCHFPNTPRWKVKPLPSKGKTVCIEGLLTGIERNDDRTVKYFIVDLEKVTFLGNISGIPKAQESPTKLVSAGTSASLKFTGFSGTEKSKASSSKKRKITADDTDSDKGEGTSNCRRVILKT
ncbi:hypothetical protein GGX14DRAFT_612025 [Mycena pura]|uniref:Uncharacterized protein n=1 Tax=Mycena pura TaxID=153505 RepID=A0AAD6YS63_9AGAR|nr:hypothetical protein GGX14DRAFT_612025 [Mycena pura]